MPGSDAKMTSKPTFYRYEGQPLPSGVIPDHDDSGREIGLWVPVEPDVQFLLDWAVDVGGDNYRPDRQEVEEVLERVLGIGGDDD